MSEKTLSQKLLIKPGNRLLLLNAPEGYAARLNDLPAGCVLETVPAEAAFDWVQAFVYHEADIHQYAALAMQSAKAGAIVWFAYPKKTGAIKTDISRDHGWQSVVSAGWEGVTQIALDDTWSALRFRPISEIKTLTRKSYRQ